MSTQTSPVIKDSNIVNILPNQLRSKLKDKLSNADLDDTPVFDLNGFCCYAKVAEVYDGDTIWVIFERYDQLWKVRVRLLGYNSPEIRVGASNPNRDQIKQAGYEARDRLSELILNQIIWIEFSHYDSLSRALATIYTIGYDIGNSSKRSKKYEKKICINQWMIENGYGEVFMP